MTLTEAIKNAKEHVKDSYALAYLNAIPEVIEDGGNSIAYTAEESLKAQILYALNNMKSWRGPLARESKATLKKFAQQKEEYNESDTCR